jgi:hypothetical protein
MTLLDAPVYNEARERRRLVMIYSAMGLLLVLFVGWWLVAGRPVAWPWNWNSHLRGRMTANRFLTAVEKNDLTAAYSIWMNDNLWQQHQAQFKACPFNLFLQEHAAGITETDAQYKAYGEWLHDKDWMEHQARYSAYSFNRFQDDWSSESHNNEYGAIKSHKIVLATMHGNVLLMAILINGRKSKALNLDYDPRTRALNFSPPGVELYLGP